MTLRNSISTENLLEDAGMKSDQFLQDYFKLDARAIYLIAHQPQDMVKSCKMRGHNGDRKCDDLKKGYDSVFTTRYGICYMFNARKPNTSENDLVSNYGGPSFGLELLIDMESEFFCL